MRRERMDADGVMRSSDGWGFGEYLRDQLASLGDRRKGIAWLRGVLWGFTIGGAIVAFTAWLDLLVAIPELLRLIGLIAAGAGALGLLVSTLWKARRAAVAERIARDVDRLAATGGEVSAALGLATEPGLPSAGGGTAEQNSQSALLSQGLAGMAVRRAEQIAGGVPEENIEPLSRAGTAFLAAAGLAAALLIVALAWPAAVRTELRRLTDPWGDHPPWSRQGFKVEPGNVKVLYGAAQDIHATVTGGPVEQLDLVVREPDGADEAMPMFEERDRTWRAQLTGIVSPMTYWVRAGKSARSVRYRIEVINTPQIESVAVRLAPPAYTHLPPSEGLMPQGGIAGLKGTQVRITVRSNRPLSRGEMEMTNSSGPSQTLTATPTGGSKNSVTWAFPIQSPGKLSLSVLDEAGERSTAKIAAPVIVLKDERPIVRILSPKSRSFATPDIALPVELEAQDDYGITRLELFRALNGTRHLPDVLEVPASEPTQLHSTVQLHLRDYGLTPGDVITLFGRVADNDPESPKGSESGIVTVTVISRELFDEILRSTKQAEEFEEKYTEAARRAENLAAEGEKLREAASQEKGEKPSPEMQKKMADLAAALANAAEQTRASADQHQKDFALDAELTRPMRDLADSIERASGEFSKASSSGTPDEMRQAAERGMEELGHGREQYAQSVQQPMEKFMDAYALLDMEEKYIEMCDRQEDLAQRAANLKGQDGVDDPATRVRMRDLQDEQRQVAADAEATLEDIWNRAHELPGDKEFAMLKVSAKEFSDAVRKSRALPAMAEAADGLNRFQGTEGSAKSAEAAEVLKSFVGKCRAHAGEVGQQGELAFGPTLQLASHRTIGQMLGRRGANVGYSGEGSGANGYSMRSSAQPNVGLYGPEMLTSNKSSEGGRDARTSPTAVELHGGNSAGGINPERSNAADTAESAALRAVPPQHRDSVRAYFKRVADETSAGTVLEEPGH